MSPVLELRGISKSFPGVVANDKIDLTLEKGEIHALLGENGAGKTTLMNILYGLYKPDAGQILVNGEEVVIHSPNDAIEHRIGMVHQHFMLIPVMTVTENIMLGVEPTKAGIFLDKKSVEARIREISSNMGWRLIRMPISKTFRWEPSNELKSSKFYTGKQTYSSWMNPLLS